MQKLAGLAKKVASLAKKLARPASFYIKPGENQRNGCEAAPLGASFFLVGCRNL
ncbi:MAG: hypothetical protein IJZ92_05130 [Bacteroidaceae bacterium]|nr:hypothetical protein [Bacteroidaceae bacterium]